MSTESDMDNIAIRTLQNYRVKITYSRNVQKNRGYFFTLSTIAGTFRERVFYQFAISLLVMALEHHGEYIHLFE